MAQIQIPQAAGRRAEEPRQRFTASLREVAAAETKEEKKLAVRSLSEGYLTMYVGSRDI